MGNDRRPDLVSFTVDDGTLHVRDDVEDRTFSLSIHGSTALESAIPALFHVPVDDAVSFETDEFTLGRHSTAFLRDDDGEHVGEFTSDPWHVERGTYFLEIYTQFKIYVRIVDAAFTAQYESWGTEEDDLRISFEEPTGVTVGARSVHSQPNTTITVPDDPRALMEAVSYAGRGLKEFSPERSWPTLRGHPPAFEPGDDLHVPPELEKPQTGVSITVPDSYADVLRVAPLAYYLGATVEPGENAALVLDNGYTHSLRTRHQSLEERVEDVLSRAFIFDSLARIGGYYAHPRFEYDELAPYLPFSPNELYDEPITDALIEYLGVDASTVRRFDLTWRTVGTVPPTPDALSVLSPLLNELAPIHVTSTPRTDPPTTRLDTDPPVYATPDTPASVTRVTGRAFENAQDRPVPTEARIDIVTSNSRRANAIRDITASDAWHRVDPDSVTVRTTLPNRETDCLVLDLPGDHSAWSALDSHPSPRTFLARDPPSNVPRQFLDAGSVSGILLGDRHSVTDLARLLALLNTAVPIGAATRLVPDLSTTLVGVPTTTVRLLSNGAPSYHAEITSRSQDDHDVRLRIFGGGTTRLGSTGRPYLDAFPDIYHLINYPVDFEHSFTTPELLDILGDDAGIPELNGELFLGNHPPTEDDVERSRQLTSSNYTTSN